MPEMAAPDLARRLRDGLGDLVVGNDEAVFAVLLGLLGDGHVLVEGVPGTAKTLVVRAFGALLGVPFRRVQFTPDTMPADVVGTTVFDPRSATFSLRRGPVFTSVLLADEINRTPPKTQAALLEAMAERQVTIDGETHALPALFIVCATQNPLAFEGTYPLPEAQLDRFFVRARTAYPDAASELGLLEARALGNEPLRTLEAGLAPVASTEDVLAARAEVRAIFVSRPVVRYLHAIVERTRANRDLALGASPRAALALVAATQAAAAIDGREFATPDDVKAVAPLVLAHRLLVRPESEIEGETAERVLDRILATVAVPSDLGLGDRSARAVAAPR